MAEACHINDPHYCMQTTSARATEWAEMLAPVSLRQVTTGVVTRATRQCLACSSMGSMLGQMGIMDWHEKRQPTSGKRKSNVRRLLRMRDDNAHAVAETSSRSWYVPVGLAASFKSGWIMFSIISVISSMRILLNGVYWSSFRMESMTPAWRSRIGWRWEDG